MTKHTRCSRCGRYTCVCHKRDTVLGWVAAGPLRQPGDPGAGEESTTKAALDGPQPHQQRVLDEHAELLERLNKLRAFTDGTPLFQGLPEAERLRLWRQRAAMVAYEQVLRERIEAWDHA